MVNNPHWPQNERLMLGNPNANAAYHSIRSFTTQPPAMGKYSTQPRTRSGGFLSPSYDELPQQQQTDTQGYDFTAMINRDMDLSMDPNNPCNMAGNFNYWGQDPQGY